MRHVMKVENPKALPGELVKGSGRLGICWLLMAWPRYIGAGAQGRRGRVLGGGGGQSQLARKARRTLQCWLW